MVKLDETHAEAWNQPGNQDVLPVLDAEAMAQLAELSRYPPSSPSNLDDESELDVYYPSSHRWFELLISSVIKQVRAVAEGIRDLFIPEELRPLVDNIFQAITHSTVLLLLLLCCCCVCWRFAGRALRSRRTRRGGRTPSSRNASREPERGRSSKQPGHACRKGGSSAKAVSGSGCAGGRKKRGNGPKFEALPALGMGGGLDFNSDEEFHDEESEGGSLVMGKTAVMMPTAWGKSNARPSRREMRQVVASNKA